MNQHSIPVNEIDLKTFAEAALHIPLLSVIVPTFNERVNVTKLFEKLDHALAGIDWEVIFVDDNSPDGTSDVVRATRRTRPACPRASGGSDAAGSPVRASKAFWHLARPSWP